MIIGLIVTILTICTLFIMLLPLPSPPLHPMPTPDPIEVELEKLASGHILFNPPNEMTLGVTEKVEIRIARNLTENLSKNLEGRGEPQFANISRLGTLMEVSLKGKNFDIDLIGGEEKVFYGEGFTEWVYYVTPLKNGVQHLSLVVNVIITLPNGKEVKKETVFEEIIYVKIYPIEDKLKKFESKLILFKFPEEMTVGIEETVEICIAKNITEDLFEGTAGVPQYSTIKIEQNLEGSNIDINSPTNRKQVVPGVGFDEWVYLVIPLKSGNQSLSLIVDVIVFLPNGEKEIFTTEFKKKINIKENIFFSIKNFIKNNWEFIVSTVVPILIALGWIKSRKSKTPTPFNVKIFSPNENANASTKINVKGTVSRALNDKDYLWILVSDDSTNWWPQGDSIRPSKNNLEWSGYARIGGGEGDIGRNFRIAVILVNDMLNSKISKWQKECKEKQNWPPITCIENHVIQESIVDEVTVVLTEWTE